MSFTIDPFWRFIIGIIVTVAIGISAGTLNLTNAIPHDAIPAVTAWCSIIAFVGSAVTTGISGLGMTNQSRSASAAAIPNTMVVQASTPADMVKVANAVASIPQVDKVTAPALVATAAPSDKVVAP